MAERNPPSWLQGGSHTAENDRNLTGVLIASGGILAAGDMVVAAPGGTMTVTVAAGAALIKGSRAFQGTYHAINDASVTKTIAAADPSNPRYDRIVAEIKDAAYSGATNAFQINVVQGTPAVTPLEPTIPADSIELARVLVGAGVTTINAGNILDRRVLAVGSSSLFAPASGSPVYAGQCIVDTFTAGGTWTKRTGLKSVHVLIVGSGAGGGSGARNSAATHTGGNGGNGGNATSLALPAALLGATETVAIGAGGAGGAAQTVDTTAGVAGSTGNQSQFGPWTSGALATGGNGGAVSANNTTAQVVATLSNTTPAAGSPGAQTNAGTPIGTTASQIGAGGGGAGGYISAANAATAPSNGSGSGGSTFGVGGGAAGSSSAGSPGTQGKAGPGGGGGGGSANVAGAGFVGGAGAFGGGGGGGGASLNGTSSGAGGAGGDGIVVVYNFF